MRTLPIRVALASGIAALAFMAPASADTFQGTVWSLTYSGLALPDADPFHETFQITLGVDKDGYSGGGLYLDQVAIKVSSSVFAASLIDAPGGATSWMLVSGGINSGGCSGSGSGFECANSLSVLNGGLGVAVSLGNGAGIDHSWVFDITVDNGALFTGAGESSLKARFVDAGGTKVGDLISEPFTLTTPIPEPGTYAMLLAGLGLLGFAARRRVPRPL